MRARGPVDLGLARARARVHRAHRCYVVIVLVYPVYSYCTCTVGLMTQSLESHNLDKIINGPSKANYTRGLQSIVGRAELAITVQLY